MGDRATITTDADVKDRLADRKRDDETWADLLERLADAAEDGGGDGGPGELERKLSTAESNGDAVTYDELDDRISELYESLMADLNGTLPRETADEVERRLR